MPNKPACIPIPWLHTNKYVVTQLYCYIICIRGGEMRTVFIMLGISNSSVRVSHTHREYRTDVPIPNNTFFVCVKNERERYQTMWASIAPFVQNFVCSNVSLYHCYDLPTILCIDGQTIVALGCISLHLNTGTYSRTFRVGSTPETKASQQGKNTDWNIQHHATICLFLRGFFNRQLVLASSSNSFWWSWRTPAVPTSHPGYAQRSSVSWERIPHEKKKHCQLYRQKTPVSTLASGHQCLLDCWWCFAGLLHPFKVGCSLTL